MPPKVKKKLISGFCANGQHEGTKPVSFNGAPMRSCDLWENCGCTCHGKITEMYQLAGMDREPPEQSVDYLAAMRAQRAEFAMPSLYDMPPDTPLSTPDGTGTPPDVERVVATPERAAYGTNEPPPHGTVEPTFDPTPTGRRARGQLEFDVLKICDEFSRDVYEWEHCTPKLVAERIGHMYATEPPSTGAINAVWDRWEKLGFAKQDKKPSRFVCFEMDGSLVTLQMLKAKVRSDKKRLRADQRRGVRTPPR